MLTHPWCTSSFFSRRNRCKTSRCLLTSKFHCHYHDKSCWLVDFYFRKTLLRQVFIFISNFIFKKNLVEAGRSTAALWSHWRACRVLNVDADIFHNFSILFFLLLNSCLSYFFTSSSFSSLKYCWHHGSQSSCILLDYSRNIIIWLQDPTRFG